MSTIKEIKNAKNELEKYDTSEVEKELEISKRDLQNIKNSLIDIDNAIRLQEQIEKSKVELKQDQTDWIKGFIILGIILPIIIIIFFNHFFAKHGILVEDPAFFIKTLNVGSCLFAEITFFASCGIYPTKPRKSDEQCTLEENIPEFLKNIDISLLKSKKLEKEKQIEVLQKQIEKQEKIIRVFKNYNYLQSIFTNLNNKPYSQSILIRLKQKIRLLKNLGETEFIEENMENSLLSKITQEWDNYINEPITKDNIPTLNDLKYMPIDSITYSSSPKSLSLALSDNQNQDLH